MNPAAALRSLPAHPTRRSVLAMAGVAALLLGACATPPAEPPAPAPAPAPAGLTPVQKTTLRSLGFAELDTGWNLDLSARVNFEVDNATISPADAAALGKVAQTLLDVGIDHVTVEGHADSQGSEAYNLRLSERRAAVVADVLAARGFASANITRRGLGASRPVTTNATAAGRLQNRRAVLIVTSL